MNAIARELRENPLLWLLAMVPAVFAAERLAPGAHRALFLLSVLAIVPLAALLSRATESVAAKTGDTVGGLLNATLGNLTELVISLTALRAGMLDLVKASLAGAIVTNSVFMLGMCLLLGGLRHPVQEFNRASARLQSGMLFIAAVTMLVPTFIGASDKAGRQGMVLQLSIALAVLLLVAYVLGLVFSLGTHKKFFAAAVQAAHDEEEAVWPIGVATAMLAGVTVLVALVSEVFVESVQAAATTFGMTPAFVGFIVVALVGAAAEMVTAFAAARRNRLDLSIGIALGSSVQIALFVAPVMVIASLFIAPQPMDLSFWPGIAAFTIMSTLAVTLVASGGRSAWFVGVLLLVLYGTFALTLYLLPPAAA
jgi:Ca2+:H+ antiporter